MPNGADQSLCWNYSHIGRNHKNNEEAQSEQKIILFWRNPNRIFHSQVTVELYYKSPKTRHFHMMFAFRDIDMCSMLENPPEAYRAIVNVIKGVCPELNHKCPFKAGEKFAFNYTYQDYYCTPSKVNQKPVFNIGTHAWPDGDYKVNVTIFGQNSFIYYARVKNGDDRAF
jgi:hypothetical protein